MNYSATQRDGSGRDAALKRRNIALREALGLEPPPKLKAAKASEPQEDEKTSEAA